MQANLVCEECRDNPDVIPCDVKVGKYESVLVLFIMDILVCDAFNTDRSSGYKIR